MNWKLGPSIVHQTSNHFAFVWDVIPPLTSVTLTQAGENLLRDTQSLELLLSLLIINHTEQVRADSD